MSRNIQYILGGIVVVLVLAWMFGLFGGSTPAPPPTTPPAAPAPANPG